ncbi:MAG TPA: DUF2283 domain-containing protein [Phycisphaerae bacterium]|nr:DUF2283 domain-containing protein [Phycisphaerae bacterium]
MTDDIYLEMTYHHGRAIAGYLYLPRQEGDKVARSREVSPSLVVDYAADGRAIGIEIISPSLVSVDDLNRLLAELHHETLSDKELAPLLAS